jgi:dihydrofolate reductase
MSTDTGKVVVNRAMSLDGFIAGPGHTMDWIFDFLTADAFPEVMAATGAMLIGRRTYAVAKQMADEERNYEGGAEFVLTHEPPDKPDPNVTFLTCDIAEAVATALSAAGGKNLEILGADLASQCLQRGLVDEILVYVLPVLLGDGVRFSTPTLHRIDLEPFSNTQSGAVTMLRSACLAPTACSNLGRPETSVIVEAYRSLVDAWKGCAPSLSARGASSPSTSTSRPSSICG